MHWKNVFLGLGFFCLLFFFVPINIKTSSIKLEDQFKDFMQQFNKTYNNQTVYQRKFNAFKQSMDMINEFNFNRKHNMSAIYGLTQYSDMTPEEFLDKHLQDDLHQRMKSRTHHNSREHKKRRKRFAKDLPLKVDWREKGIVTKVNNQKLCGACWAFSVIENMESMYAIKTKNLTQLSVQQLIDCAGYNNEGCEGGDACALLEWLQDYNISVHTNAQYPLHLQTESCKKTDNGFGIHIDQFACDSLVNKEDYILKALADIGPVSVAINALSWQNYLGGIIQFHCGSSPKLLNHAVQIVGYDLKSDIPYYIVRNSWGENFGNKGYLYIAIGKNICGLANEVTVLTVL